MNKKGCEKICSNFPGLGFYLRDTILLDILSARRAAFLEAGRYGGHGQKLL
jgi:hypothetical protein